MKGKLLVKCMLSKDLPKYIEKKSSREKKPKHFFLDPKHRKYPVMQDNGKAYDYDLLVAARRRSAQYKDKKIYKKAGKLLKKYFKDKYTGD